jgi:hypothetical protein
MRAGDGLIQLRSFADGSLSMASYGCWADLAGSPRPH